MRNDSFWLQDARVLVDCAMGRSPADLVIRDGQWVCVQTGEIIPHTDIAVVGDRIAFVGADASHTIGAGTKVIQAEGRYLVPGLLDAHMHVESGMLTVTEFVRAVLPHGTTGIFADPHEIANVFGLRGVRLMVDEAGTTADPCFRTDAVLRAFRARAGNTRGDHRAGRGGGCHDLAGDHRPGGDDGFPRRLQRGR